MIILIFLIALAFIFVIYSLFSKNEDSDYKKYF